MKMHRDIVLTMTKMNFPSHNIIPATFYVLKFWESRYVYVSNTVHLYKEWSYF